MKFGVRDICDVVFKAKAPMTIGTATFRKGQPVLYIDTATASSLEQSTTTTYAQGGKGNTRLVTWEGEKTLTFTVTDALLSPIGLAILSGAGLFQAEGDNKLVHVHSTAMATIGGGKVDLSSALKEGEKIDATAPVFVSLAESDGSITGQLIGDLKVNASGDGLETDSTAEMLAGDVSSATATGNVFVDFYVTKKSADVPEIQIDATSFGGNFYVEASTLFRDTAGTDLPAEITLPNVKIQSNFSFNMSATGDPSTFDFVMDAMPDYTMFDRSHKVMCVIQIVQDAVSAAAGATTRDSVMRHYNPIETDESKADSTPNESGETE